MSGIKFRRNLKTELEDIQVAEVVYAVDTDEWGLGLSDESVVWRKHVLDFENILLSGVGVPSVSLGKVGFMYVDTTDTNGIFIKNEIEWVYKKHPASKEYITANFLPPAAGYDETSNLLDTDALQLLIDPGFSATDPLDIISKGVLDAFVAVLMNDGSTQMVDGYIPDSYQKPVTLKNLNGDVTMILPTTDPSELGVLWNDNGVIRVSMFEPVLDCDSLVTSYTHTSDGWFQAFGRFPVDESTNIMYGMTNTSVEPYVLLWKLNLVSGDVEVSEFSLTADAYYDMLQLEIFNGKLYFCSPNDDDEFDVWKFNLETLGVEGKFTSERFGYQEDPTSLITYYQNNRLGFNSSNSTIYLTFVADDMNNSNTKLGLIKINSETMVQIGSTQFRTDSNLDYETSLILGAFEYHSDSKLLGAVAPYTSIPRKIFQIDLETFSLDWENETLDVQPHVLNQGQSWLINRLENGNIFIIYSSGRSGVDPDYTLSIAIISPTGQKLENYIFSEDNYGKQFFWKSKHGPVIGGGFYVAIDSGGHNTPDNTIHIFDSEGVYLNEAYELSDGSDLTNGNVYQCVGSEEWFWVDCGKYSGSDLTVEKMVSATPIDVYTPPSDTIIYDLTEGIPATWTIVPLDGRPTGMVQSGTYGLTSENYPSDYPSSVWTYIDIQGTMVDSHFEFTFGDLILEQQYDHITVNEGHNDDAGNRIAEFGWTGGDYSSNLPTVISATNQIRIHFSSDSYENKKGFAIRYFTETIITGD